MKSNEMRANIGLLNEVHGNAGEAGFIVVLGTGFSL